MEWRRTPKNAGKAPTGATAATSTGAISAIFSAIAARWIACARGYRTATSRTAMLRIVTLRTATVRPVMFRPAIATPVAKTPRRPKFPPEP